MNQKQADMRMNFPPSFEISLGSNPYGSSTNILNGNVLMNNQFLVLQNANLLITGDYQIQIVKAPKYYMMPSETQSMADNTTPLMVPVPENYYSNNNWNTINTV